MGFFTRNKTSKATDTRLEESANMFKQAALDLTESVDALRHDIEKCDDFLRRIRAIYDLFSDAVVLIDGNGDILAINSAAETMFGFTKEEAEGQSLGIFMPINHASRHSKYVADYQGRSCDKFNEDVMARIVGHSRDLNAKRKNGEIFSIELSVTEIVRDNTKPIFLGIMRDVTARKAAEEQLKRQRKFFEDVLNSLPINVFIKDQNGNYLFANKEFCECFGIDPDKITGSNDKDIWNPEILKIIQEEDQAVLGASQPFYVERKMKGNYYYVGKTKLLNSGNTCVAGFSLDIHEKKMYERKIDEQQMRLKAIFNNSPYGMLLIDKDGKIVECNRRLTKMLKLRKPDMVGKMLADFVHSYDRDRWNATVAKCVTDEAMNRLVEEFRLIDHESTSLDCRFTINEIDSDTDKAWFAVTVEDISEITDKERQIKALVNAIDHATDSILIADKYGKIVFINDTMLQSYGYTREEVVGQTPKLFNSGTHNDDFFSDLWETIKGGSTWEGKIVNRKKDGTLVDEWMVINPIHNGGNRIAYYMAIKKHIQHR